MKLEWTDGADKRGRTFSEAQCPGVGKLIVTESPPGRLIWLVARGKWTGGSAPDLSSAKLAAEASAAEILRDGLRVLGRDHAPRLLAALEALTAQVEAHIAYPCPELDEAKAAIAAAKGEG